MLGVSQSISVRYLAPAPLGSWLDIDCQMLTIGKTLCLINCEIWRKEGPGETKRIAMCTMGNHTKIDNSHLAKM